MRVSGKSQVRCSLTCDWVSGVTQVWRRSNVTCNNYLPDNARCFQATQDPVVNTAEKLKFYYHFYFKLLVLYKELRGLGGLSWYQSRVQTKNLLENIDTFEFFHNSHLIRWIQQNKIYKKLTKPDQRLNPEFTLTITLECFLCLCEAVFMHVNLSSSLVKFKSIPFERKLEYVAILCTKWA